MAHNISKHIKAVIEEITTALEKKKTKIAEMIADSDTESVTLPVSVFISDAPGTQRVTVKLTLTEKVVVKSTVDIDSDQVVSTTLAGDEVVKESLAARQKNNAAKEKLARGSKKPKDADKPA